MLSAFENIEKKRDKEEKKTVKDIAEIFLISFEKGIDGKSILKCFKNS